MATKKPRIQPQMPAVRRTTSCGGRSGVVPTILVTLCSALPVRSMTNWTMARASRGKPMAQGKRPARNRSADFATAPGQGDDQQEAQRAAAQFNLLAVDAACNASWLASQAMHQTPWRVAPRLFWPGRFAFNSGYNRPARVTARRPNTWRQSQAMP